MRGGGMRGGGGLLLRGYNNAVSGVTQMLKKSVNTHKLMVVNGNFRNSSNIGCKIGGGGFVVANGNPVAMLWATRVSSKVVGGDFGVQSSLILNNGVREVVGMNSRVSGRMMHTLFNNSNYNNNNDNTSIVNSNANAKRCVKVSALTVLQHVRYIHKGKLKTNHAAKARFRKVASGKYKRAKSGGGHFLHNKSRQSKRDYTKTLYVDGVRKTLLNRMLPWG